MWQYSLIRKPSFSTVYKVLTLSFGAPFQCGMPGANVCVRSTKRCDGMTANASSSDTGVFLSAAFAHTDAVNAAARQVLNTLARMNSLLRTSRNITQD